MIFRHLLNMRSHPTWVRGLKHILSTYTRTIHKVAPYVGAWIETFDLTLVDLQMLVAPYVGAWIETHQRQCHQNLGQSHPTWVRGLKPLVVV